MPVDLDSPLPVRYNGDTRTFEVYSEDYSLIGTNEVTVRPYLEDYPDHVGPAEAAELIFLDPCAAPDKITAPAAPEFPFLDNYSAAGVRVSPAAFSTEPSVCKVAYECVKLTYLGDGLDNDCDGDCVAGASGSPGGDEDCDGIQEIRNFDPATGSFTFQTTDIDKYPPGDYEITIRGTTGSGTQIADETVVTLTLVDPCPTAELVNVEPPKFEDIEYLIGRPAIPVDFLLSEVVQLDIPHNCGEIKFEMHNGLDASELDADLFSFEESVD